MKKIWFAFVLATFVCGTMTLSSCGGEDSEAEFDKQMDALSRDFEKDMDKELKELGREIDKEVDKAASELDNMNLDDIDVDIDF